jgi:Lactoylglutathione lyase and related lyases
MANESLFLGVDHTNVRTADLEKSVKFYTEVLGFREVSRHKAGPLTLVMLSLNETTIELASGSELPSCQDGLVNHLALKVSDINAAFGLLKNYGVEFMTPEPAEMKGEFYYFLFRGPSREKIEVVQPV